MHIISAVTETTTTSAEAWVVITGIIVGALAGILGGVAAIISAVKSGRAEKAAKEVHKSVGKVNGHGSVQDATGVLLTNQLDIRERQIASNERLDTHITEHRQETDRLKLLLVTLQDSLAAHVSASSGERNDMLLAIDNVRKDLDEHVALEMRQKYSDGSAASEPPAQS
jgi:hypothetical protein